MKKTATCKHCGDNDHVDNMVKVKSNSGNYHFLCTTCNHRQYGYSDTNDTINGKDKVNGFTFGFEFETQASTSDNNFLFEYGFIPTFDCTVKNEWKTPIYKGLSPIPKMLKTLELRMKKGSWYSRKCGSHINCGNTELTNNDYNVMKDCYRELFTKLAQRMLETEHHILFGRVMNEWCSSYYSYSNHSSFLTIRSNRIELRTPLFNNKNQYMLCVKFTRDILKTVTNNFVNHVDTFETVERHYRTEYSGAKYERKLEVTNNKLIKLYDKYLEQARAL